MNEVLLRGYVSVAPALSHISHGSGFYQMELDVPRLSGVMDRLRILTGEKVLNDYNPKAGEYIEMEGQMRSYNNKTGEGSRLIISALARRLRPCEEAAENRVLVSGTLCRTPGFRKTPLGREICDIMLAAQRTYNRTDYLPLITWGQTARECSDMETGMSLFAQGRFQSRVYTKVTGNISEEKTAYEISIVRIFDSEEELAELRQAKSL